MNKENLTKQQFQILNNQIIKQYCNDYEINISNNIKPQFQHNEQQETVAMWLTQKHCLIPKYWIHNNRIKNKDQKTLKDLMIENHMPVPQYLNTYQNNSLFEQAYFGAIPSIGNHKPDEQNNQKYTVAMLLAYNNSDIPQCWYHDPNIQNCYGETVAMIQARCNKIPDKQWQHNKYLRCEYYNNKYYTVQNILQEKQIDIPDEWQYQQLNNYEDNQAMIEAKYGIIPKLGNNDPQYRNIFGQTVNMILLNNFILPSKEWELPINEKDILFNSQKEFLICNEYKKITNYYIPPKYITYKSNDICQICFNQKEQEFMKTECGHNICLECFKQLSKENKQLCPICRQTKWFTIQYQEIKNEK